jgi:hypothetical protein
MKNRYKRFWDWFIIHESYLRKVNGDDKEIILESISHELNKIKKGIFFEMGGSTEGPFEIIFSPGGKLENVSHVVGLVDSAPKIEGWNISAFKKPHGFGFVTEYEGLLLDPKKMWFLPLISKNQIKKIGLRISCPTFSIKNKSKFYNGCYIVLECAIGELSVLNDIDYVEVSPFPKNPEKEGWIEFNELENYISWKKNKK